MSYEEIETLIGPPPHGKKRTIEPHGWEGIMPSNNDAPQAKPPQKPKGRSEWPEQRQWTWYTLECKAASAERGWWCGYMSSLFLVYFFISPFLQTSFVSATVLFSPTKSLYNFSLRNVTFGHAALLGPSCRGCAGESILLSLGLCHMDSSPIGPFLVQWRGGRSVCHVLVRV